MTVFHNRDLWDSSNVRFEDGRIVAYDKKLRTPKMRHIDYGLGVFDRAAFGYVPKQGAYDLADLYRQILSEGELAGYEVAQRFYEVGSFQGIEELSAYLAEHEARAE
jgi:NDP-sugar pyrophosphorylase family protein